MDFIGLVLAILKLVNFIMDYVNREQLKQDGRDEEIARQTAAILAKTEYARNVREKISTLDDEALNTALRDLEPKPKSV